MTDKLDNKKEYLKLKDIIFYTFMVIDEYKANKTDAIMLSNVHKHIIHLGNFKYHEIEILNFIKNILRNKRYIDKVIIKQSILDKIIIKLFYKQPICGELYDFMISNLNGKLQDTFVYVG